MFFFLQQRCESGGNGRKEVAKVCMCVCMWGRMYAVVMGRIMAGWPRGEVGE